MMLKIMRRILSLAFVLSFTGVPAQDVKQTPRPGQTPGRRAGTPGISYAIVVGVSNYSEQTGLTPLQFAAKDASALGAELAESGYQVRMLLNADATKSFVNRALNQLAGTVSPEDRVVFYFSGHGFQGASTGRHMLATHGVAADDIETDGLALDDVLANLDRLNTNNTAAFVDACRTGSLRQKSGEAPTFRDLPKAKKTSVFYSTQPGQPSFEDEARGHGVFTRHLLEGLRGKARDAAGAVSMDQLSRYVRSSMQTEAFASGKKQSPVFSKPEGQDFALTTRKPSATVGNPPVTPPASRLTKRVTFASGSMQVDYDASIWTSTSTASDRLEFAPARSSLSAVVTHDYVQSSLPGMTQQAIDRHGGAGRAKVLHEARVVRNGGVFQVLELESGDMRYSYLFYTGQVGKMQAVVYGRAREWDDEVVSAVLEGIGLSR